jgi:hypothetical protein
LLAVAGAYWFSYATQVMVFPFELDYGEGPILHQLGQIANAGSLYSALENSPYTVTNYPPVYKFVVILSSYFVNDLQLAGRLVSFSSTLISALLVVIIVFKVTGFQSRDSIRYLAAITAGLLFLFNLYVQTWSVVMRVDMLAVFWELTAILLFISIKQPGVKLLLAVPFFILAGFTKPSIIAGAGACFLVSFFYDRQLAIRFFLAMSASLVAVFFVANLLTDGQFWIHHVIANKNAFSLAHAFVEIGKMFTIHAYGLLIIVSLIVVVHIFRQNVYQYRLKLSRHPVSEQYVALTTVSVFWCLAFMLAFSIGKKGSYVNYLIEFVSANSILFGVALVAGYQGLQGRQVSRALTMLVILIMSVLLVSLLKNYDPSELRSPAQRSSPLSSSQQEYLAIVEEIRAAKKQVIAEDMTVLYRAGKPLVYQPFIMAQLAYQGLWDQGDFVEAIQNQTYSLIVLSSPVEEYTALMQDRFTPQMITAIKHSYRLQKKIGKYNVYQPKQ